MHTGNEVMVVRDQALEIVANHLALLRAHVVDVRHVGYTGEGLPVTRLVRMIGCIGAKTLSLFRGEPCGRAIAVRSLRHQFEYRLRAKSGQGVEVAPKGERYVVVTISRSEWLLWQRM